MGRKHRLTNPRKNEERKKYAARRLQVSIPLSAIPVFRVSFPLSIVSVLMVSIPRAVFVSNPATELPQLQSQLRERGMLLPLGRVDVSQVTAAASHDLVLCKPKLQVSCPSVDLGFTLRVDRDFRRKLFLSSEEVQSSSLLDYIPETLNTVSRIMSLLTRLNGLKICEGNADDKFRALSTQHKGVFMDPSGTQATAKVDQSTLPYPTIRHRNCALLIPSDALVIRCKDCSLHCKSLRSLLSRQSKAANTPTNWTDPTSHVNTRYLHTPEKNMRMKNLHSTVRSLSKRLDVSRPKLRPQLREQPSW